MPVLARHAGENLDQEPVAEMLLQHVRIRGLTMQLDEEVGRADLPGDTLQKLGELPEVHIRLEERIVFPMIEKLLPEDALKEVASRLEVFEAGARSEL